MNIELDVNYQSKKPYDCYLRSPYASWLEKIGFQAVCKEVENTLVLSDKIRATFASHVCGSLQSHYEILQKIAKRREKMHTYFCKINNAQMQGVLVREHSGYGWFRKGFPGLAQGDLSLIFVDVTDEVKKIRHRPQ